MSDNSKTNPWVTLKSIERFDNPWIKIVENDCLNPSGNPAKYSVVHFKNIAVGVLPIDPEGYTYLVGQFRYPLNTYEWEIPEGGCPASESPLDTAKRELLEETGIVAGKYTEILHMALSDCVSDELSYSYLAEDLSFKEASPEDCEKLTVQRVKFSEAFEMVMNGKIRDALSVATIMKYQLIINGIK